jgi:CRISPR-associated protein Cas2
MDHRLVITYDITDNKLRARVHKYLSNFGLNTQKSVFELIAGDLEVRKIIHYLHAVLPDEPTDSVRIYELCKSCGRNITKVGDGVDLHSLEYQII